MKKILMILLSLIIVSSVVFVGIGCKQATETTAAEATTAAVTTAAAETTAAAVTTAAGAKKRVAILLRYRGDEFYKDIEAATTLEAVKRGYEPEVYSAEVNLQKQVEQLENLIATKPDMIVMAAMDASGIVPTVEEVNAAGIPIVAYDQIPTGGELIGEVVWDLHEAGYLMGEWTVNKYKEMGVKKATWGVLTWPESEQQMRRVVGFKEAIEGQMIEIVAEATGGMNMNDATVSVENMIQIDKKLDGIFAMWSNMAFGAIAALQSANMDSWVVDAGCWGLESFNLLVNKDKNYKAASLVSPFELSKLCFDIVDAYFAAPDSADKNLTWKSDPIKFPIYAIDEGNFKDYANPDEILKLREEAAALGKAKE